MMVRSFALAAAGVAGAALAPLGAQPAAAACSAGRAVSSPAGPRPSVPHALTVPSGFVIDTIARVPRARELVALPNGDLLVGTLGRDVYVIPNAESAAPAAPAIFASLPDERAAGVAFSAARCEIFIAAERGVYATPYAAGDRTALALRRIARVRTGPIAPHSDGDVHVTTSVAFSDKADRLYVAVGSSCNACVEADPTRAAIFQMTAGGSVIVERAKRIRNAIALTVDPDNGALWAGTAGQDDLPFGHPYEFLDAVTMHRAPADYGWPDCEEDRVAYAAGADCSKTVAPMAVLPAYSTIVAAAFYPREQRGRFAFPAAYRGALFVTAHGSWHANPSGTTYAAIPQVVTFAMRGDRPATTVNWHDPNTQWRPFAGGFQSAGRDRAGRPTGIAVGPKGSLFVADDAAGAIYRIRPR